MMTGILSAWFFIKKRVYLCPPGAACPGSFNPDNSFLQDFRTVIQYWVHVGMLIFGVGLMKLVGYQAWSAMQQRGNTIDILGHNLGAVKGSASDAAFLLLLRRRDMSLGVFVLTHVAIIIAISLVIGKSISTVLITDTGSVELSFDYPMNVTIPIDDTTLVVGTARYGPTWAWLSNTGANSTPLVNENFSGTFIVQDGRAEYGVNAQPSGQQISGSVSCVDPSASIVVTGNSIGFQLNVIYMPGYLHNISGNVTLGLDPTSLAVGKLIGLYLPSITVNDQNTTFIWLTINNGIIPNAMEVSLPEVDDVSFIPESYNVNLFIGLCEHTVTFSNLSVLPQNNASGGMQYIQPSQPTVYLPPGGAFWVYQSEWAPEIFLTPSNPVAVCHNGCMTEAIWNTLLSWWIPPYQYNSYILGQGYSWIDIYCYGGVLSPAGGDTNQNCPILDDEIWSRTLALVLDGMIQTYPSVGNSSQILFAQVESIGTTQWWLQGIIPLSAFILYVACLAYTVTAGWGGETMKELDLLEVVNATRAEEERLTKLAMVRGDLGKQVGRLRE